MLFGLLADLLVLTHLSFILFVVLGGLFALRWPRMAWVHLPAAVWGAWIEFSGWICPLTPWEQELRRRAGQVGYSGGFIQHYLIPLIYPGELTRAIQLGLGLLVLALNITIYAWVWKRAHRAAR